MTGLSRWFGMQARIAALRGRTPVIASTGGRLPAPAPGVPVSGAQRQSIAATGPVPSAAFAFAPPDAATYEREAQRDPHATPPSLQRFAASLAPRMELALGSEPQARSLFGELAACARDGRGVEAARALCAVNAGRLAEAHPGALGASYRGLRAELPEELVRSVEASGY